MLTVVCINWKNYLGRGWDYVERLHSGIRRNLTIPHEFVCLTETELGTDLKGWWVKMRLAESGRFNGWVLYLDLDVVITANIDHLVELAMKDPSKLWMREDFSYPYSRPRQDLDPVTQILLGGPGCCNSSVMLWHGDTLAPLWDVWQAHASEFMATHHGDQNTISSVLWPKGKIALLPDASIQSFKYGMQMRGEPPAPIVVFHGKPKVSDLPARDPLRQVWETAA